MTIVGGELTTPTYIILTDMSNLFRRFICQAKDTITIGRGSKCDIVIDWDKYVSRIHCRIAVRENRFYLSDIKSTNGTYVNHKKITDETQIYVGNMIQIGYTKLKFDVNKKLKVRDINYV